MSKIVASKLNEDLIKSALSAAGITPDPKAKPAQLANLLQAHYVKTTPKDKIGGCDVCGGISPLDLDSCPFCGSGEEVSGDAAPEAPSDVLQAEEAKEAEEGTTPPFEIVPATATPEGEKKKGKGGRKPKVVEIEVLPEGVTVEALDAALIEVKTLRSTANGSVWDLGAKIAQIHDGQLYKARKGDDGTSFKYKSFATFAEAELGISHTYAYNLIDFSKQLTRDQVALFGPSKALLYLKAPDATKPTVLELIEKDAPKREIEKIVSDAKAEAKAKGEKTSRGEEETGRKQRGVGEGRKAKSDPDKITIATLVGKKVVDLYKKPEGKKAPSERASTLADFPVGILDLENGVRMTMAVVADATGKLSITVNTKRIEQSKLAPPPDVTRTENPRTKPPGVFAFARHNQDENGKHNRTRC